MYTFDHGLFMALNFDGGTALDRVMLTISGTAMWLPLYALILWLVWRRSGWRGMSVFLVLMLLALGLSDIVSGIFKHNGLLGDMLPQFEPRPRPMFTPSLEGLEITPDSLRALRRAAMPHDWAVHVPPEAVSGMYGTVSAHAALRGAGRSQRSSRRIVDQVAAVVLLQQAIDVEKGTGTPAGALITDPQEPA